MKNKNILFLLIFGLLLFTKLGYCGDPDDTTSQGVENFHRERLLYPPAYHRLYRQLLEQKSFEGDSIAQHELSIRYLTGKGLDPDTAKSAFWMNEAAKKKFVSAIYNYGIFLNSGIGVEWDPFEAFKYVQTAADSGMSQARFVYGLFHTDNLIVDKNYDTAYYWINKAAEDDFEPAKRVREKMIDRGLASGSSDKDRKKESDSTQSNFIPLMFNSRFETDFTAYNADSSFNKENDQMVFDMLFLEKEKLLDKLNMNEILVDSLKGMKTMDVVAMAAKAGSPEALLILGRCRERGIRLEVGLVQAMSYYMKAYRLGAVKAREFINRLIEKKEFHDALEKGINNNESQAMYVRAGMAALHLDRSLTEKEALKMLIRAKNKKHVDAMIELGLCYYTGNLVDKNMDTAIRYWRSASKENSWEAKIRLIMRTVFLQPDIKELNEKIDILRKAYNRGSILAQTTLAYCYQYGIGVNRDKGKAAELYRDASYRGSHGAFNELKKMYDEIRPDIPKFQIDNK